MSPLESPKVMGLQGIHHPKALHHHVGLSYCSWCRKEGQNEGTIVNHLLTMHYKLGLICSGCLHCPAITSEAIWHHGPSCKCLSTKEEDRRPGDEELFSSDKSTPGCHPPLWHPPYNYVLELNCEMKIFHI